MNNFFPDIPSNEEDPHNGFYASMQYAVFQIEVYLIPELIKMGYNAKWRIGRAINDEKPVHLMKELNTYLQRFVSKDEKDGLGMFLEIWKVTDPYKFKTFQCFVKKNIGELRDYPRFNFPKEIRELPDHKKIPAMLKQLELRQVYFLIMIKPFGVRPAYFWIDKFSNYPEKNWKLGYQQTAHNKGRMCRSRYMDISFYHLETFKAKLDKIFNNGN